MLDWNLVLDKNEAYRVLVLQGIFLLKKKKTFNFGVLFSYPFDLKGKLGRLC